MGQQLKTKQADLRKEALSGGNFRTISVAKHAHGSSEKLFEKRTAHGGEAAHSVHVALSTTHSIAHAF